MIIQNAMRTPEGVLLVSAHRHDYTAVEENGHLYAVDGGTDYLKRSYPTTKLNLLQKILKYLSLYKDPLAPTDLSVDTDMLFPQVRERLLRGTRGKHGDEKFNWVILKDMDDAWVKSAIKYNKKYHKDESFASDMYRKELEFRGIN